jgi:CSLREA domain-containing protein
VAAAVFLVLPGAAGAQTPVTVNTTADGDDGACTTAAGGCTLREAASRTPDDAVIALPAGSYVLTQGPLVVGGARQLQGAGARSTTISGDVASRVVSIPENAATAISGVSIMDGDAVQGGGIFVAQGAELDLVESMVRFNVAETGGGIYSEGNLIVTRSTIAFNGALEGEARGGGLAIVDGGATLVATTVSGNFSDNTGGGLYTSADVTLESVTIAQNQAFAGLSPSSGGGIQQDFQSGGGDLTTASATLVVENFGGNCLGTAGEFQIQASDSMADDGVCNVPLDASANNLQIAPNDLLGFLDNNGGPTDTHALLEGHPALDHARTACAEADQRSHPSPQGGACDAGAYEAQFVFEVNTTADEDGVCTEGGCSLREAVTYAGVEGQIFVPSGEYRLERGQLELIRAVVIEGENARTTTLVGSGDSRVLMVFGSATVSNVRITGGTARIDDVNGQFGGGIFVVGELELLSSTVDGNRAEFGGGIVSAGSLTVRNSTISSNEANGVALFGGGGGLLILGPTELINTTVSGNTAPPGGAGIFSFGAELEMNNVTVAGNTSPLNGLGSALLHVQDTGEDGGQGIGETRASNTIIAGNAGVACAGNAAIALWDNVITDDGSCNESEPVSSAGLAELGDYGGPTDTHALLAGSPAVDAGDAATCEDVDQRNFARSVGQPCDVGAVEGDDLPAATLRVATAVVNDAGGTAGPGNVSVNVRAGEKDVLGSPRPGVAGGRRYLLSPGTYAVSGSANGYTTSVGGECAPADGTIALQEGEDRQCTITFNDVAQQQPPPSPPPDDGGGGQTQPPPPEEEEELPPPEAGESVNVAPTQGTVKIKLKGSNKFVELQEGQQIPLGTEIDTRKGRVTLTAASNKSGGTATAEFYDGLFVIGQTKGAKPTTTLTLTEKLSCPKSGKANAAAKKKKRRLWGDGKGRFRTDGEFSSATVRGTKWLTEDSCNGTLTRVVKGSVSVRDFAKKKTVVVKAGKKYVARRKR